MWTLRTNGSEPLTRQVKEEKLKLRAGKRSLFPETELNVWKCALKLVVDEVPDQLPDIPFAEYLIKILESERSESRRDPDKLCDLISLIAWMRRFQKPLEEEDKADIVDLYFALQIGLDAITQTIGELDKKEQKIFRTVQHGVDEIVTRRYVANETGIPYKTCYRLLEKLIDKGFMLKEKRGRENEYSTPSGKQPKEFLIVESSSKNNAKQLMQFILSSFGTLSPSQGNATQKKFSLIDLITGDQVTVTPTGEIDVEKKTILYPDDNVRTSKRSEETLSKPQNKSARAEKRAAGATSTIADIKGKILEFGFWMKKQGYRESTIKTRMTHLEVLSRRGATLFDPESIKKVLALQQRWSGGTKANYVDTYSSKRV